MHKYNFPISVVIPCYNVEGYIHYILDALNCQTFKEFELILVDDGSKDNTVQVAKNYLQKSDMHWQVITQENTGQAGARNNGIKQAKGQWIICPDSDDYIVPTTLEKMYDVACHNNVDCVFCNIKYVSEDTIKNGLSKEDMLILGDSNVFKKRFFDSSLRMVAPGMLLKRTIFDKIEYDADCPFTEDTHFIWRLFYTVDKFAYITGDYYNYLMRSNSTIHTLSVDKYLKTSSKYKELGYYLASTFPKDFYAPRISYRQRLGSLRMLAKCNSYELFRKAVITDGYRKGFSVLLNCGNLKIMTFSIIYNISIKLFYFASNLFK